MWKSWSLQLRMENCTTTLESSLATSWKMNTAYNSSEMHRNSGTKRFTAALIFVRTKKLESKKALQSTVIQQMNKKESSVATAQTSYRVNKMRHYTIHTAWVNLHKFQKGAKLVSGVRSQGWRDGKWARGLLRCWSRGCVQFVKIHLVLHLWFVSFIVYVPIYTKPSI